MASAAGTLAAVCIKRVMALQQSGPAGIFLHFEFLVIVSCKPWFRRMGRRDQLFGLGTHIPQAARGKTGLLVGRWSDSETASERPRAALLWLGRASQLLA